jgi:hypothetical protein
MKSPKVIKPPKIITLDTVAEVITALAEGQRVYTLYLDHDLNNLEAEDWIQLVNGQIRLKSHMNNHEVTIETELMTFTEENAREGYYVIAR